MEKIIERIGELLGDKIMVEIGDSTKRTGILKEVSYRQYFIKLILTNTTTGKEFKQEFAYPFDVRDIEDGLELDYTLDSFSESEDLNNRARMLISKYGNASEPSKLKDNFILITKVS